MPAWALGFLLEEGGEREGEEGGGGRRERERERDYRSKET
jgi:hypothetical protein